MGGGEACMRAKEVRRESPAASQRGSEHGGGKQHTDILLLVPCWIPTFWNINDPMYPRSMGRTS